MLKCQKLDLSCRSRDCLWAEPRKSRRKWPICSIHITFWSFGIDWTDTAHRHNHQKISIIAALNQFSKINLIFGSVRNRAVYTQVELQSKYSILISSPEKRLIWPSAEFKVIPIALKKCNNRILFAYWLDCLNYLSLLLPSNCRLLILSFVVVVDWLPAIWTLPLISGENKMRHHSPA